MDKTFEMIYKQLIYAILIEYRKNTAAVNNSPALKRALDNLDNKSWYLNRNSESFGQTQVELAVRRVMAVSAGNYEYDEEDLCESFNCTSDILKKVVKKMEKDEFIEVCVDEDDEDQIFLKPTEKFLERFNVF